MKKQNKKTTKYVLTAISFSIILTMGMGAPVIGNAHALTANDQIIPEDVAMDTIKKNHPSKLTEVDLTSLKQITLSDATVQKVISGKPYEIMSQGFLGNIKKTPVVWYPTIQFNVDNKTDLAVVVDLKNNSIKDVQVTPLRVSHLVGSANGIGTSTYAEDYYTGSHSISGVYATMTSPNYNAPVPKVAWLVNGLEYGANANNACNSAYAYNNYFGQAGLDIQDGLVAWTNTNNNCIMQNGMIGYFVGHQYLFEVYSDGAFHWDQVVLDQNTGLGHLFTSPLTAANTLTTNNHNTSVFYENHETSSGWASRIIPSNNVATNAHYKDYPSGTWNTWDNDARMVTNCQGIDIGNNSVMTGSLIGNGQTTWNLSNFQQTHC